MSEAQDLRHNIMRLVAERDQLRTDLAALYALLREVRYTQTVGEINHIRLTCDAVGARWKLVRP